MRADVAGEERHDLMLIQHESLELVQLALLTLRSAVTDLVQQVQKVGPITGVNGMTGSYVIIRLPNNLPRGNLSMTVTLRGKTSAPRNRPYRTLEIVILAADFR